MFSENRSNILNFKNLRIKILFFLCFFLVLLPSNGFAKLNSEIVKSKATKVVMMLDIVAKEYALGIQNGKIINAMEFEESQIFLNQAQERYGSIIGAMPNSEKAKELETKLQVLSGNIKEKVDPEEVKITINAFQTKLLKELGIEILKSPPRPIDMNNGGKIFLKKL